MKYIDTPSWDNTTLVVNKSTPVLGGIPRWSGDTFLSGHYNIPYAHLANKTRWLKEDSDEKPDLFESNVIITETLGRFLSKRIDTLDSNILLTEEIGETVGQFDITLNAPSTVLNINIPVTLNTYRTILLSVRQGTGDNLITLGENILWQIGDVPHLSKKQGSVDIIRLISSPYGNGIWYGVLEGSDLSPQWTLLSNGSWVSDGSQISNGFVNHGAVPP